MNIKKSIITALAVLIPSFSFAQGSFKSEDSLSSEIAESILYNGKTFLGIDHYSGEKINKIKSYLKGSKTEGFSMVDFSRPGEEGKIGIAIADKDPINLLLLAKEIELTEDDASIYIINFKDNNGVTLGLEKLSNYKFVCVFNTEIAKQAQNHNYSIGTVTLIDRVKRPTHHHPRSTSRAEADENGLVLINKDFKIQEGTDIELDKTVYIGTLTDEPHAAFKNDCIHMEKVNLEE